MQRGPGGYRVFLAAIVVFASWRGLAGDTPADRAPISIGAPLKTDPVLVDGFTEEELVQYSARFKKELWPMLTRNKKSCVSCHDSENDSQLHMLDDPDGCFKRLVEENWLNPANSSAMFVRLTAADPKKRMPKAPAPPWTEAEVALLRNFGTELHKIQRKVANNMDEQFPMELLQEYRGQRPQSGPDTTFITFYQLRRKVKAIFGDDWNRNGKDMFNENIALFGGADFVRSYNESATASATFLSGIDILAGDVASRAYLCSSGPFRGSTAPLPPPNSDSPNESYRAEINRLFNRILFRNASEQELKDAFKLFQNIQNDEKQLSLHPRELRFELKVEEENGLASVQDFMIPITSGPCGLYQEYINQNAPGADNLMKHKLGPEFTFKANDSNQRFEIQNGRTNGNVSIAGIELTGPLPAKTVQTNSVKDPSVQILGAWTLKEGGFASFDDDNENKGSSNIIIPIHVAQDGKYEVTVTWRKSGGGGGKDKKGRPLPVNSNTENVLVEVLSYDPTKHAPEALMPVPPKGEAHFFIDQTLSNIPYWNLNASFQFAAADGVELNNALTHRQVVADAVHFAQANGSKFMVRGTEAEGNEKWKDYNPGQFKPYNTFGPKLFTDGNNQKGELKLLYKPVKNKEWKENEFYTVMISCPGKAGNETQAPVIVHAQKSSPILQVCYPQHVHAGGTATMDASASYNLQGSKLKFTWTQTGGPKAELSDPHAAVVTFTAPAMSAQQAAWEGLCRALLRHPDFLFTRPPSVASVKEKSAREKLQLVKLAQDLIGRTPSDEDFKRLESGTPIGAFVEQYLNNQEFKDFYFHRIRLILESHGSESDDEPTRLWSYVAFNDRPFKEILTADYTVDKNMKRQPRPAYHGKTGLLTMRGFIDGKPGLPHFNYPAIVCEKFLGYVFEVPASIVAMREGATAVSTTSPQSTCYSCHKILTPLAFQRTRWTDDGKYHEKDEKGRPIDDTDHKLVDSYSFKGSGMEAFALQAQNKERFIRTMIQTHFVFYFGREMRYLDSERSLYKRVWDEVHADNFSIRGMIRTLLTSPEYLEGQ